jgi:NAD-dependent deacetylase
MDAPGQSDLMTRARGILANAENVAVLTGSGISAESGVPTFRGAGGIWEQVRAEDVATPQAFVRDPAKVWRWHNEMRTRLQQVSPNPAHFALAKLQRRIRRRNGSFVLATQNIDGLHQAAGSEGILELHGSLMRMRCVSCGYREHIGLRPVEPVPLCPECDRSMRPDVVWFGEVLPQDVWSAAVEAVGHCQILLTVGTSATVYPAAGLIEVAVRAGAKTIEVNLEPTSASHIVDIAAHGRAGEILPKIVA